MQTICLNSHYTFNVATFPLRQHTVVFSQERKSRRDTQGEKMLKESVCLNDFTVFQVPTEESRINVTVGILSIALIVEGAQEIHTATLITLTYSGYSFLVGAYITAPMLPHSQRNCLCAGALMKNLM